MKRFALPFFFAALVAIAVACSSKKEECNCPSFATVTLTVFDGATGEPIPIAADATPFRVTAGANEPTFFNCVDPEPDGGACSTWAFSMYGPATIHVTFPGYAATDISTNVSHADDCCGSPVGAVRQNVPLQKL